MKKCTSHVPSCSTFNSSDDWFIYDQVYLRHAASHLTHTPTIVIKISMAEILQGVWIITLWVLHGSGDRHIKRAIKWWYFDEVEYSLRRPRWFIFNVVINFVHTVKHYRHLNSYITKHPLFIILKTLLFARYICKLYNILMSMVR